MLQEVITFAGSDSRAAQLLGVPVLTVRGWVRGVGFRFAGRRVVWLTWALLLHPGKVQTAFDLVTWGKFRK